MEDSLEEIERLRHGYALKDPLHHRAIILLHGIGGTAYGTYPLGQYLFNHNFVDVYGACLEGHATEPKDLKKATYRDWILQIEALFDKLSSRYQHVYLLGNSLGSLVALAVAEERKCAGVCLLSSPIYYSHSFFYLAPLLGFFGLYHHWNGTGLDPKKAALVCYDKIPYKSVAELNKIQHYARRRIEKIASTPALALFGEADPLIAVKKSLAFYQNHLSFLSVTTFPGMGHGILFCPKQNDVFEAVGRFLD
jgi:Esterase/lipase